MRKRPDLSFIDNIEEFQAIPTVVMELIGLFNESPGKDIEIAIVNKIGLDPALTAFVLKFCNSPLFAHRVPVNTISHALNMIGFPRAKSIMMSYFLRTLLNKKGKRYVANFLWEHAFQVAFTARELANHLGWRKYSEEAYIAGLLHDIGKMVIYFHDPDTYDNLLQQADKERKPVEPLEKETYGYSHTETGSYLIDKWKFSDLLKHSIQYHHDFDQYPGKEKVVGLVAFANNTVHYGIEKQEELPEQFLTKYGLSENQYNRIQEDIFRILTESWLIALE